MPHSDDLQLLTAQTADCLFVFRKFSISNKIPDTKGCLKCCVGKSYTISHLARVDSLSSRDPGGCGEGVGGWFMVFGSWWFILLFLSFGDGSHTMVFPHLIYQCSAIFHFILWGVGCTYQCSMLKGVCVCVFVLHE